jgi:hypothetical protein
MPVRYAFGRTSFRELLDRVVEKGIVIDAWYSPKNSPAVTMVGTRVVIERFDLHLQHPQSGSPQPERRWVCDE